MEISSDPACVATCDVAGHVGRCVAKARRSQLSVLRLQLEAVDGSPILAHVGPEHDLPLLRPGDRVHVGWLPEASLVLPAADLPAAADLEECSDDF